MPTNAEICHFWLLSAPYKWHNAGVYKLRWQKTVIAFATITFEVALGTVTNSNPCDKDKGSIEAAFY